jgi:hypothetical protein
MSPILRYTIIIVGILLIITIINFRDFLFPQNEGEEKQIDADTAELKLPYVFSHGIIRSIVIIVLYLFLICIFVHELLAADTLTTLRIIMYGVLLLVFLAGIFLEIRKLLRLPKWRFSKEGLDVQASLLDKTATHYDWSSIKSIIYKVELGYRCKSELNVFFRDADTRFISYNIEEHPGVLGSGLTARKHSHWIARPLSALCKAHDVTFEMK